MNDIDVIHLRGAKAGFVVIDCSDFESASSIPWYRDKDGYAVSNNGARKEMGGWLLNPPEGFTADHKNRFTLDNRRCNLRIATPTQQNFNQPKRRGVYSSKYKGVTFVKDGKKRWQAAIHINKKKTYLGFFTTEGQAAMCYNDAAYRNYGEFAVLNEIKQEPVGVPAEKKVIQ